MPQTSTIPVTGVATAVLKWQVVETNSLRNRWVIAAFDLKEDALDFAEAKADRRRSCTYMVREDPEWTPVREAMERFLRRPTGMHEPHENLEPVIA